MKQGSVITIDLGASKVRFAAVNNRHELTEYLDVPPVDLINNQLDNGRLIGILVDGIRKVYADLINEKENNSPVAISIGSPGSLDPFKGIIEEPPNLPSIRNLAIVDELKKFFPTIPTFLLNDADAAGLGELWVGAGRKHNDIVLLTLGSGLGSAVIASGKLQRGLGKAAEWGHTSMYVENDQRLCSCGQWCCSEAYLGTKGLSETYARVFGIKTDDLSDSDRYSVSPKMRKGIEVNDPKWLKVLEEYAKNLAVLLRNIIKVHQPEVIILGGGIAYWNTLLAKTKEELKKLMDLQNDDPNALIEGVEIKLAQSEIAAHLGAAKYALEQLSLKEG